MATQGIVTVMRGGDVIFKIIAGCNGYKAPNLAKELKKFKPRKIERVHKYAELSEFGCKDCLVILSKDDEIFEGLGKLNDKYYNTFNSPRYNPRWEKGTAGYVEVVEY